MAMQYKFPLSLGLISFAANSVVSEAGAQVVLIPHGDIGNDFEKYLVAAISIALLCFATWRFFRRGR